MKIVHTFFSFNTGGAELMAIDIMNEQIESTVVSNVALLVINDHYNHELLSLLDSRISVVLLNRKKSIISNISAYLRTNLVVLFKGYDIFHSHDINTVRFLSPLLRCRKIITVHDVGLELSSLGRYDQLIAISKSVQKDIKTRYDKKSLLVYNGISVSDIAVKKKETSTLEEISIVQVGRVTFEKKRQDLTLEAFQQWLKFYPCLSLTFVGEGNDAKRLAELILTKGLSANVNVVPKASRAWIYRNLKNFNLLVLPSSVEGFGLALIEGMAASLCVLASNVNGPLEIVENEINGFLFNSGDLEDYVVKGKKIIDMIAASEEKAIVKAAHDHVSQKFDIKTTTRNYIKIYEETLC